MTTRAKAEGGPRVRVVIADDSPELVETLLASLAHHPVLEVVGTAADGTTALSLVADARPDVVLMDLRLGGVWGLDLLPAMLAGPGRPAVVVFSAAFDPAAHRAIAESRAAGHVTKGAPLDELFDALVAAAPTAGPAAAQS